jgi:hypothetical protein
VIEVRLITVGLVRNLPVGESHFRAYPDSMVAEAKALRAQGWTLTAIADKLGCHHTTVLRWVNGCTRKPPSKVIAKRVKVPRQCLEKAGVPPVLAPENQPPAAGTPVVTPVDPKTDDFSDLA